MEKRGRINLEYALFRLFAVSAQSVASTSIKRPPPPTVGQTLATSGTADNAQPAKAAAEKKTKKASSKKEKQQASNSNEKNFNNNNNKMTTNVNEPSLRDLSHPTFNDQLKSYNTATFKLVKTGECWKIF